MEVKYGGRLPEWRYRTMSAAANGNGAAGSDDFEEEAHSRLAAAGLPWCFGEMNYPHWRLIPDSEGSSAVASYYAGDDLRARECALGRLILCARCPVFDRCHKVTTAKKSAGPQATSVRRKHDLLAALGRM